MKQSQLTGMKTYTRFLFRKVPRMTAAPILDVWLRGTTATGRPFSMKRDRLFAELVHSLTVASTSTDMYLQKIVRLMRWCIYV